MLSSGNLSEGRENKKILFVSFVYIIYIRVMELIQRQLPEAEHRVTKFIRHRKREYVVTYDPRTGDQMFDNRETAERNIKIRQSYVFQKAVVIFDKGYDCYLLGFEF